MKPAISMILGLIVCAALAAPAVADQQAGEMTLDPEEAAQHFQTRGYSPYADRGFPTRPMWGDTHLHTTNSPDVFAFGNRLGPEEAYRFTRGETVTSATGQRAQLSRPLDFLVAALKDPYSRNLDRIQIIKGWLDKKGKTREKVYDVVWGDAERRKPDKKGKVPPVGNTVDQKNAIWTNTIGDSELITVWKVPDFDPKLKAFYYARVIEIPTPRWTAYDAKRYGITMDPEVPMVTQERAYTSPIWYSPDG